MSEIPAYRKIIHIDLDAFFCAVEELRDPSLRNQPFAVGGNPEHRGVVASCSYAARKFGIHSAMPMGRAVRLCPQLKIVHHHFSDYIDYSHQVMDLLNTYTSLVQPISIDEAFLDVTELAESGLFYAQKLQDEIKTNLRLPASLGVATNKLVAKVATNVGKASVKSDGYPFAIHVVPPGQESAFLEPLPADALWGVGAKTAEKLAQLGIHTIGDIVRYPTRELERVLGPTSGGDLQRRALGIDTSGVHVSHETKSISHEETFARDTNDEKFLRNTVSEQSQSLGKQLRRLELFGSTVKLKLRWPDFKTISRQSTLPEPTDEGKKIEAAALELLFKHWKRGHKVRLIGIGVSNLGPGSKQLNLWDWDPKEFQKKERLEDALKNLHSRYGDRSVRIASALKEKQ